jgi:uncharacterized membrane protein
MNQISSANLGNAERNRGRAVVQRWSAVLGGGALAIYGLTRRSPLGVAMAATGGAVAFLGTRPNVMRQGMQANATMQINCSPEQAYQFWHNFENLPLFMRHLDNVSIVGNGRSRWTAIGVMGKRVSWDAETIDDRANEFISWRSTPDSQAQVSGFVAFRPAIGNRGTIVETSMEVKPPAGALGVAISRAFGKDPSFLIRQDLRRLKALIEAGEIPTIDGQSHGRRSTFTAMTRLANPDLPIRSDARFRDVLQAQRRIS